MKRNFFTPVSAAFFALLTGFLFFVTSCSKEESAPATVDQQVVFDVASRSVQAQLLYTNVMMTFLQAAAVNPWGREACPSFSIVPDDEDTYPKTATIDFGSSCTDPISGVSASGKIVALISASPMLPGTIVTITPDSLYIGGVHIEGDMTLLNASTPSGIAFAMSVEDGKITWPGVDTSLEFSGSSAIAQTAGITTPTDFLDDTYAITGDGTMSWGSLAFTTHVATPLVKNFVCSDFLSGVMSMDIPGHTASIDFGTGGCDHTATVTVDGDSQEVPLPH